MANAVKSAAWAAREKENLKLVYLINGSDTKTFKGKCDGKLFVVKPQERKVVTLGEARFLVGDQEETDKKKIDDMIHDRRNWYGDGYNPDVYYEYSSELNSEGDEDDFVPPSLDLEE